ncbi:hypothetical protein MRX96_023074 [Rhipicephalus microplus]
MTADVSFLNESCILDCPDSAKEKVAIDPLRMAVSAAPPHSIADTSIGRRNCPRVGLSSLPLTRWLRQTDFQSYPFLAASIVVLPHLSAPSHCFADGMILAEGRLLLTLEFCWFPVSVFHRYP